MVEEGPSWEWIQNGKDNEVGSIQDVQSPVDPMKIRYGVTSRLPISCLPPLSANKVDARLGRCNSYESLP